MSLLLPDPPTVDIKTLDKIPTWARSLYAVLSREFSDRTPDLQARDSVLLTAPNGSVWEIKVDNTGTLSSTKVYG